MTDTRPLRDRIAALTLGHLQAAHMSRQEEWCPDQKPDLSFRGNELGGECGEAQNVIKKLERERHGWRGSRDTVEHLGEELADVIHCAVLCAITAGIDIEQAVIDKFNATSENNGLSTRLDAQPEQRCAECDCERGGADCTWIRQPSAEPAANKRCDDYGHRARAALYEASTGSPTVTVEAALSETGELVGSDLEMKLRTAVRGVMKHHNIGPDGVIEADLVRDALRALAAKGGQHESRRLHKSPNR